MQQGRRDPLGRQVPKGHKALPVRRELPAPKAHRGLKDRWGKSARQVLQALRARKVRLVLWE